MIQLSSLAQLEQSFKTPFPKQYAVLDSIVDVIAKQDAALANATLHKLESAANESNSELCVLNYQRAHLRYQLMLAFQLKDKALLKKLIDDSEALLLKVDEKKYPEIAALIHMNMGNSLCDPENDYDLAFDHYLRAYKLFKTLPKDQLINRQYDQYLIALAYFNYGDFESALLLGEEIVSMFPALNYTHCFTRELLALSYVELAQYDKALINSQWILKNYKACGMAPLWQAIALEGIGYAKFSLGSHTEAISPLKSAIAIMQKEKPQSNQMEIYAILSSIYTKQNKLKEAQAFLDSAKHYMGNYKLPTFKVKLYEASVNYYKATGNYKQANVYQDSIIISKDIVSKRKRLDMAHRSELRVERELKNKQEQELILEQEKANILILVYVLGSIFLLVIGFLIFRNMQSKHRLEKTILDQKNHVVEVELNQAKKQLDDYVKLLIDKNAQLKEAFSKLSNQPTEFGIEEAISEEKSTIPSIRKEEILTKADWNSFSILFSRLHPTFIPKIEAKFPSLTQTEVRYLVLLKMELNHKDMANLLVVSDDAIRQTVRRIKRKLQINVQDSLTDLIQMD